MKNIILSFIIVCSCLCCKNSYAQAVEDQAYTSVKSKSLPKKVGKANELKYLILGGMAINASQQSSGFLMVGVVKKLGGYLKAKTDFNFDESPGLQGKSTDSRYFTNETEKGRCAITGGLLWHASTPIMFYGGLGFGNRWINWKTVSGEPYRVTDYSFKGLELETGLIFKIQKFVFSGGVSVTSFNNLEANIGVGILFGIPPPKIKATRVKAAHGGRR